jgi:hypothetical protein
MQNIPLKYSAFFPVSRTQHAEPALATSCFFQDFYFFLWIVLFFRLHDPHRSVECNSDTSHTDFRCCYSYRGDVSQYPKHHRCDGTKCFLCSLQKRFQSYFHRCKRSEIGNLFPFCSWDSNAFAPVFLNLSNNKFIAECLSLLRFREGIKQRACERKEKTEQVCEREPRKYRVRVRAGADEKPPRGPQSLLRCLISKPFSESVISVSNLFTRVNSCLALFTHQVAVRLYQGARWEK